MNYYDFLYRWKPFPAARLPGYFWFDCIGIACSDCIYLDGDGGGFLGCVCPKGSTYGWDFILAYANRLLEEGVLYK